MRSRIVAMDVERSSKVAMWGILVFLKRGAWLCATRY